MKNERHGQSGKRAEPIEVQAHKTPSVKVHLPDIDRECVNACCPNEAPGRFRIGRPGVEFGRGIEVAANAGKSGKLCFDSRAACMGKAGKAGDHCD